MSNAVIIAVWEKDLLAAAEAINKTDNFRGFTIVVHLARTKPRTHPSLRSKLVYWQFHSTYLLHLRLESRSMTAFTLQSTYSSIYYI